MIVMVALGVGIFLGFNIEWYSIDHNTGSFFEETKLADYRANRIRRLFHPKYPAEYLERRERGWEWLRVVEDFYGRQNTDT